MKNNTTNLVPTGHEVGTVNTDRVQGRQIENPLISKNHKRKRGSDSSSDCTLTIEGADTS